MTQIPAFQPARWSRNGIRIVVVPGAELPRFRLEIDPTLPAAATAFTGPFSSVLDAERAAEAIASSGQHRLSA
ncbi:hypothetical protein [Rathayibacter sp. VKM Ac-2760]|uniref:hypothetical protein n=1 Tax=Rathayibacter sp. VKM Ac-2760 TaxID=2609253 RepID=UPI001316BDA0|nr:hypothetical protein [Rathayibacter sp. VKM Ac-2760]QHC59592.1 hypothetical protein GSU72_14290 [Rathayibacter sp. VKM Ac-2760]